MSAHRYVEENGLAAMLANKRLAGVAPKVNLRECEICMSLPSVNKVAHSGFKTQRRYHTSPKKYYQWPHKKYYVFQNFFKNLSDFMEEISFSH